MASVSIELVGWDKIVAKYGKGAADKAVKKALEGTVQYTADLVKGRVAGKHHVTGYLASSIIGSMVSDSTAKTFARPGGGTYYAKFVERGTGILGPRKMPIKPTRAKVMSWHPRTVTGAPQKGAGRIARRSTKGQKPIHMFHNTYLQDRPLIKSKFKTIFRRQFGVL